jgi:putative endonuclease
LWLRCRKEGQRLRVMQRISRMTAGLLHALLHGVANRWPHAWLRWGRPRGARLGQLGETVIARNLARRGWTILARRCSTPFGELDIVARQGRLLIAIEVKTGRVPAGTPRWTPGERFHPETLERQLRAAAWMARRTTGVEASRVDLCEVRLVGPPGRMELHHQAEVQPRYMGRKADQVSGAWLAPPIQQRSGRPPAKPGIPFQPEPTIGGKSPD